MKLSLAILCLLSTVSMAHAAESNSAVQKPLCFGYGDAQLEVINDQSAQLVQMANKDQDSQGHFRVHFVGKILSVQPDQVYPNADLVQVEISSAEASATTFVHVNKDFGSLPASVATGQSIEVCGVMAYDGNIESSVVIQTHSIPGQAVKSGFIIVDGKMVGSQ